MTKSFIKWKLIEKLAGILLMHILLLCVVISPAYCQNRTEDIPASDLEFLYERLTEKHPKLSLIDERQTFDSLYHEIAENFKALPRTQAIMEMIRLVASLHDGHTSFARLWDEKTKFRRLPLKFYFFSEGLYITKIGDKYQNYAGMKVIRIGNQPIENVVQLAMPYLHGDNDMKIKEILPHRLVIFDFLEGLGLTEKNGSVNLTIGTPEKEYVLNITPINTSDSISYKSSKKDNAPQPLYAMHPDQNYWYKYLEKERLIYFKFNVTLEMEAISFKTFVDSLFNDINTLPVEKLVIDLRNNNGGDNSIIQPLIHSIICNAKINRTGRLFTIIGRNTFSAAVNLVTELETHTKTIFVGEPTLAPPNHYGETNVVRLPYSDIMLLYSTQFWQGSLPWDKRPWIEPTIKVELSIDDYINGRDPILQSIINF